MSTTSAAVPGRAAPARGGKRLVRAAAIGPSAATSPTAHYQSRRRARQLETVADAEILHRLALALKPDFFPPDAPYKLGVALHDTVGFGCRARYLLPTPSGTTRHGATRAGTALSCCC